MVRKKSFSSGRQTEDEAREARTEVWESRKEGGSGYHRDGDVCRGTTA